MDKIKKQSNNKDQTLKGSLAEMIHNTQWYTKMQYTMIHLNTSNLSIVESKSKRLDKIIWWNDQIRWHNIKICAPAMLYRWKLC